MYNSILLSRYLALYASNRGVKITHTTLQKLLYIVYGTYLAIEKEAPCDEQPCAWLYGPVFERVREHYSKCATIERESCDPEIFDELIKDQRLNKVFDKVLRNFGSWSVEQLINWSMRSSSPWAKAIERSRVEYGGVIDQHDIEIYFAKLIDLRDKSYVKILDLATPPLAQPLEKSPQPKSVNPDSLSLAQQQMMRYGVDTSLRVQLVRWMMWFIPAWLVMVLLVVAFADVSEGVKIALLGSTTVNVLGLPLIVLRGLFEK